MSYLYTNFEDFYIFFKALLKYRMFMNKPPTVLIVDDKPAIADLADIALRRYGYQVLKATRPSQALDIASQTRGGN